MAAFRTMRSLYSQGYKMNDFVKDFVYEPDCLTPEIDELLALPCFDLLVVHLPRGQRRPFPVKLEILPELMSATFAQFCDVLHYSKKRWRFVASLVCDLWPAFVRDEKFPYLGDDCWDSVYRVLGDDWLAFILTDCPLFARFPNDCFLQLAGTSVVEYRNASLKRESSDELPKATSSKKFKSDDGQRPAMTTREDEADDEGRSLHDAGKAEQTQLTVQWRKLVFSRNPAMGFPRQHIMEALKSVADSQAAGRLIEAVFCNAGDPPLKSNSGEVYKLDEPVLEMLKSSETLKRTMQRCLINHRRCHFWLMFQTHCTVSGVGTSAAQQQCCTLNQVQKFMSSVIHRVVPPELLGSKHNKVKLQRFCRTFLQTCYFDQLSLAHLLRGFRIKDCKWVSATSSDDQQFVLSALLLKWLFVDYLLPCLCGFFYITDADGHRRQLLYFPKDIWRDIQSTCIKQLLDNQMLQEIPPATIDRLKGDFAPNFCLAKARLLPKKTFARPVVNFKNGMMKKDNVYAQARVCLKMLQFYQQSDVTLKGCAISGHGEFHEMWRRFVYYHRDGGSFICSTPLYFVKLDIQSCFASMNLDRLEQAIAEMGDTRQARSSMMKMYFYYILRVIRGNVTTMFRREVFQNTIGFLEHLRSPAMANKVVNYCRVTKYSWKDWAEKMMDHLKNTHVQLAGSHYRLLRGVAQGSPLSHCLCDIYYGSMERKFLQEFLASRFMDDFMSRYVDDYLYVTPEHAKAIKFLETMQLGMPEYNCSVSPDKTLSNVYTQEIETVPYFGIYINTKTLEVTANYSQYAGHAISDSIHFDASTGIDGLKTKMLNLCGVAKKAILFDMEISSKKTVIKNLYQHALMMAFRLHSLMQKLPKSKSPDKQPSHYLKVIMVCIKQISRLLFILKNQDTTTFTLMAKDVKWICLQGFVTKLKRHRAQYRQVLTMLSAKIKELENGTRSKKVAYLRHSIGQEFPPVFQQMRN